MTSRKRLDTLDNTPTVRLVKLRSPINGEVFLMEFRDGVPPTLDAMIAAQFVVVDDAPKTKAKKETSHGTSEADGRGSEEPRR